MGRYLICWLLVLGTTQAVAGEGPWVDDPDRAMALSRQTGRPVLFHFWNEQCPPCRKVETFVFTNGQVLESLDRNFIPVKVNTTRHPELVRKYRVERIPQDVIVLPDGRIAVQTQSPLNSRNYLQMLEQVAAQSSRPDAGADVALARAIAYNDPRELGQMPRGEGAPTSVGTARERADGVAMRHRLSGTATSNPVAAFDSVPVSAAAPALPSATPPSESRIPIVGVPTVPSPERSAGPVVVSNPHVPVAAPTSTVAATVQGGANGTAQLGPSVGGGGAFRPPGAAAPQGPSAVPQSQPVLPSNAPLTPGTNPSSGPIAAPTSPIPQSNPAQAAPLIPSGLPNGSPTVGPSPTAPGRSPAEVAAVPRWPQVGAGATAFPGGAPPENPASVRPNPPTTPAPPTGPPAGSLADRSSVAPQSPSAPPTPSPGSPPQPAAEPSLGLDGFCPVALIRDKVWQEGDRTYGCVHRGRVYLFCCAGHRDEFMTNPDAYAPVLSGYDPVIFAEQNRLVEGKREHGAFVDDRIILFADEVTFAKFRENSATYVQAVKQAMAATDSVRR